MRQIRFLRKRVKHLIDDDSQYYSAAQIEKRKMQNLVYETTENRAAIFGKLTRIEFAALFRQIRAMLIHENWTISVEQKENCSESFFDLILIFQSYPDEFSPKWIDEMRRKNPLSPIIVLLGSHLLGEGRTGRPIETPFRFYLNQWKTNHEMELLSFLRRKTSVFGLPATSLYDDMALYFANKRQSESKAESGADANSDVPKSKKGFIVSQKASLGCDAAMNQLLADWWICRSGILTRNMAEADMILVDSDDSPQEHLIKMISKIRCDFPDRPIWLWTHALHHAEISTWHQLGIEKVFAKPLCFLEW
ncbi:MAG: hypothetical protein ACRCUY_13515 [Thermoguttaceae bacterium]